MKCDGLEKWYAGQCSPSCVVYGANEVDATIAELKDVIHELRVDLEGAKATAYADSIDAGMRERRLKRALYKACAMWADRTRLICSVFGSDAPLLYICKKRKGG